MDQEWVGSASARDLGAATTGKQVHYHIIWMRKDRAICGAYAGSACRKASRLCFIPARVFAVISSFSSGKPASIVSFIR